MMVKCIEEIYTKYIMLAREAHPDLFRKKSHTTATHMIDTGVPLVVIKQFLGHAYLSTTEIYAKISTETVNRSLEKWSKDFWGEYMDEPLEENETKNVDTMPSFLK